MGAWLIEQLARDGIDTVGVLRRPGAESALMIDTVTADGQWRSLEFMPSAVVLSPDDIGSTVELLRSVDMVMSSF